MKAVIYARFSSAGQREESIEGQIRECLAFAKRKEIEVVGEYTDRALSATTDKRPDFQRMIRDSAHGGFDAVICWKHDRFARNRYDAAVYKARLRNNGVQLLYAMEDVPEGSQGVVIDAVMEGFAEYYSVNLSENVLRGLYESALKRQTMGVRCLGLTEGPDKKFIQDENAPVVRRIFEEYASGRPSKLICRDLNAEGFRTARGATFTKNSIRVIIQNPKYYGLYKYRDIEDLCIPPIVSRELWDRAQEVARLHSEAPARKDTEGGYILSGKLFCGLCGESMTAASGTSKTGRVHQYYACDGRRQKKNGCEMRPVQKKDIEERVCLALRELIFSDDFIESAADYFMEWQGENDEAAGLKLLTDRLAQNGRRIENITNALADINSPSLKKKLTELETERKDIERGISEYQIEHPYFEREQIVAFLSDFRNGDLSSPHWRVYLVKSFLNRAYAFPDGRVILHLNVTGSDDQVTLDGVRAADEAFANGASSSATPRKFEHLEVLFLGGLFAVLHK